MISCRKTEDFMPAAELSLPIVLWFRNDLRIKDNPALHRALQSNRPVIGLFVLEENVPQEARLGGASRWWLHHSLASLGDSLADIGIPLVLQQGNARETVLDFCRQVRAAAIVWSRRYDPHGIAVDKTVKAEAIAAGIEAASFNAALLVEPWELKTGAGGPFRVFTPFWKALRARGLSPDPVPLPAGVKKGQSGPRSGHGGPPFGQGGIHWDKLALDDLNLLPRRPNWAEGLRKTWVPGERGAWQRLASFLDKRLTRYADERDFPASEATSMLSPHLRFGEISPRQIWQSASYYCASQDIAEKNLDKFLSELAWREFSYHLLFHNSHLPTENYQSKFNDFPWVEDEKIFEAWTQGETGYPIVDAGMRELWHTGYMHNRLRMIVASFLIKHLMIDWRKGAAWFFDTLVDADIANNSSSWQWVAGSGADAAPYFRIFNPILQGEKFDPQGTYVRRWVPELKNIPLRYLFRPWQAPEAVLAEAGVRLARTYPRPIVDHDAARQRALNAFRSLSAA